MDLEETGYVKVVFELVVEDTSQGVSVKPSLLACWPKGRCEFWGDFRKSDHNCGWYFICRKQKSSDKTVCI